MSIPDRWLFPYQSFDVASFLRALGSPRLADTPGFAEWIEDAARLNDINPKWLLMTAEKEQSFLIRPGSGPGWSRAKDYTMGYGATDSHDIPRYKGTRVQVYSAAAGLRGYLTPGRALYVGKLVGKPYKCNDGEYTPQTLAEAAQLQYTPWRKYLPDTVAVWERLFGKEPEMASGFESVHPIVEQSLRQLGLASTDVTQGWGYAAASAGFHEPVGENPRGRKYGPCVDLSWSILDERPVYAVRDHLLAAGAAPFFRCAQTGWNGSNHIHCVWLGLKDWQGRVHLPPGPRQQIIDLTRGRDGLAGHDYWRGPREYWPEDDQQLKLTQQYESWATDLATRVYDPAGDWIPCYAFREGDTTRCEVRAFVERFQHNPALGWRDGRCLLQYKGATLDLAPAHPRVEGWFTRANVRQLAELLGLGMQYEDCGSYAVIRLKD